MVECAFARAATTQRTDMEAWWTEDMILGAVASGGTR